MAKEKYCPHCGTVAKPKMKGSSLITILLLLCAIIPGVIYDIWRGKAGRTVCPSCRQPGMIPLDSPMAIKATGEKVPPSNSLNAIRTDDRPQVRL